MLFLPFETYIFYCLQQKNYLVRTTREYALQPSPPFEERTFFVFSIWRKTTKKPQQNKVVSSKCERDLTKVNCLRHFIHNNAWRVCLRVSVTPVTNGTKSTEGISRLLGNKCRYPILDRSLAILLLFSKIYLISNVYDKHSLN